MRLSTAAVSTLCLVLATTTRTSFAWVAGSSGISSTRRASTDTSSLRQSQSQPQSATIMTTTNRQQGRYFRQTAILAATVEDTMDTGTDTDTAITSKTSLPPAFQAALDMSQLQLEAAIPKTYHTTMLPLLQHFLAEYLTAAATAAAAGSSSSSSSSDNDADDVIAPAATAARILQCIQFGLQFGTGPTKMEFAAAHTALRAGDVAAAPQTDFYQFGNDFFRPCMDLPHSVVAGQDNLQLVMDQLAAGENVVFLANHQSEADPQVVSCLLESLERPQATDMAASVIYVAGHKVTTDALAIPFSMGRNLICIHSKKHIDADPTTKSTKQRQNLQAMSSMLGKLKAGGCLLWVAPSGGRDRRDTTSGKVPCAPFDSKTIDMFRLMGSKSKVKTHYYTLAMVSYNLCPPPDSVEAGTGESRNVRFVPVGIAVGNEVESIGGLEHRHAFCEHAYAQCVQDYERLEETIAANVLRLKECE